MKERILSHYLWVFALLFYVCGQPFIFGFGVAAPKLYVIYCMVLALLIVLLQEIALYFVDDVMNMPLVMLIILGIGIVYVWLFVDWIIVQASLMIFMLWYMIVICRSILYRNRLKKYTEQFNDETDIRLNGDERR